MISSPANVRQVGRVKICGASLFSPQISSPQRYISSEGLVVFCDSALSTLLQNDDFQQDDDKFSFILLSLGYKGNASTRRRYSLLHLRNS